MIETIEAALFYSGAGSLTLSVGLFIGGVTWNKFQNFRTGLDLPIYMDLPEGHY